MIKFIYATDLHITDRPPKSRSDDYYKSIKNKLCEIDILSRLHNCSSVFIGGDWFNRPQESYTVFQDIYNFLKLTFCKWEGLCGHTHDFANACNVGYPKSTLASLEAVGALKIHGEEYTWKVEDVTFYAGHYAIVPAPFFGFHVLWQDFNKPCDVVLCSHIHIPYGIRKVDDRTFVALGSVSRNAADNFNLHRQPQVALITVNGTQFTIEPLTLDVPMDVFDEKYLLDKQDVKEAPHMRSIAQLSDLTRGTKIDVQELIVQIGQSYSKDVVEKAIEIKKKCENAIDE